MIEAAHLTKRFGAKTAVDDLSFTVAPGAVTGFLGPNGAGKPDIGIRHFFCWTAEHACHGRGRPSGAARGGSEFTCLWRTGG